MMRDVLAAELVGFAVIGIYRTAYTVKSVGAANDRPRLVRGLIQELDEVLKDKIRRR
jgi:hypothetical protein